MIKTSLRISLFLWTLSAGVWCAPPQPGEKLKYDLSVQVAEMPMIHGPIGTLTLTIQEKSTLNGVPVLICLGEVKTLWVMRPVYQLEDTYLVWINAATGAPMKVEKKIHEGSWTNQVHMVIDVPRGVMSWVDARRAPQGVTRQIPRNNVFDLVSFILNLRHVKSLGVHAFTLVDTDLIKPIRLTLSEGNPTRVKILDKSNPVSTVQLREEDSFGIRIVLAKDFNMVPVEITAGVRKVSRVHLAARAELVSYEHP